MTLAYAEPLVDYRRQVDRPSASALRELEFLHLLAVAPCDLDVVDEDPADSQPVAA